MTIFIDLRQFARGGDVVDFSALSDCIGASVCYESNPPSWMSLSGLKKKIDGKNVLLATHGFNVDRESGRAAMGTLEADLRLAGSSPRLDGKDVFIGVLWPGDAITPYIDYPIEGNTAERAAALLAVICDEFIADSAQSVHFASHSLGGRLVLETVLRMRKCRVESLCLTAAAVDSGCLARKYVHALERVRRVHGLASRRDRVLQWAYPAGDLAADFINGEAPYMESALGRNGPTHFPSQIVVRNWRINSSDGYGHGDYFPSVRTSMSSVVARFVVSVFKGVPPPVPPAPLLGLNDVSFTEWWSEATSLGF